MFFYDQKLSHNDKNHVNVLISLLCFAKISKYMYLDKTGSWVSSVSALYASGPDLDPRIWHILS